MFSMVNNSRVYVNFEDNYKNSSFRYSKYPFQDNSNKVKIPSFDGKILDWIKVNEYFEYVDVEPSKQVFSVPRKFKDSVLSWWEFFKVGEFKRGNRKLRVEEN